MITITNRRYLGSPYSGSPSPTWLIRNTGDWYRLGFDINVAFEYIISQTNSISLLIDNTIRLDSGQLWQDFGFEIGDTINFEIYGFSDISLTPVWVYSLTGRQITYINGSDIKVNGSDITIAPVSGTGIDMPGSFTRIPFQDANNKTQNSARIWVNKLPKSISFKYGFTENSDYQNPTISSIIDGNSSQYITNNIDSLALGSTVNMSAVGIQSGAGLQNVLITYIGASGFGNDFQIQFDSFVPTLYDDISNFINQSPPDWLLGSETITDMLEVKAYPRFNNPNLFIKASAPQLGNVGWFNENFNGLQNDFSVKGIEYFDAFSNEPIQSLSYAQPTKVKAIISGVQNLVQNVSSFNLGFAWCPENSAYYKNKNTPIHKNLLVNTAGATNTGTFYLSNAFSPVLYHGFTNNPDIEMNVKNVRFSQSGNDVVYEATFEPTSGFNSFIQSIDEIDRNYCLWISAADSSRVLENTNRVSLLLDFNKLDLFIPPIGSWDNLTINFYEHPNNGTEDLSGNCGTDFIVEDDLLMRADFFIEEGGVIPNGLEFIIEAVNVNNGDSYNLDKYSVNFASFPSTISGIPLVDFEATRGFKYVQGNNKNWIKVVRNPSRDTLNSLAYIAYYGFKIRYEDWIPRIGVPNDFYNPNLENNGFNNDWYNYQNNNWNVHFSINLLAAQNGNNVRYVNTAFMPIRDYLQNPNISTVWNFYRYSDNQLLNTGIDIETGRPSAALLDNEQTKIEVIFTRNTGAWANLSDVYATVRLEVYKGSGQMDLRQISSMVDSENDNPLKPLNGETRLKLTLLNPTQVKAECIIEPSLLIDALKYKHSARIGCNFS